MSNIENPSKCCFKLKMRDIRLRVELTNLKQTNKGNKKKLIEFFKNFK